MVRRDYSGMTLITPDSPNYNRGVLYGILKDVNISENGVENKDILMYNKENEAWENKNMDKYLEDNLVDGGGVPRF